MPIEATNRPHDAEEGSCVRSLGYVSLYYEDYEQATAFYSTALGGPTMTSPDGNIRGWRCGTTWLTLFPSRIGTRPGKNPANAEFALSVAQPEDVDALHRAFVDAGARTVMEPQDTWMYEAMRFACVDDPFGARIDVLCPLPNRPDLAPKQPSDSATDDTALGSEDRG